MMHFWHEYNHIASKPDGNFIGMFPQWSFVVLQLTGFGNYSDTPVKLDHIQLKRTNHLEVN